MNLWRLTPLAPLAEDGGIGRLTTHAIGEFQRRVLHAAAPDCKVHPNGETLATLRDGLPGVVTEHVLRGVMIRANSAQVTKYYVPLVNKMAENGISSQLRVAHFLAQIAHESGDLRYAEEIASGDAYEGRVDLGNTQPGDGKRFKGRGLIQLTGRHNYTAYGAARGVDYTANGRPGCLATDPFVAVDVSCWFWTRAKLNELADLDDVEGITKKINGGTNGLADRKAKLARAKFFLGM